MTPQKLFESAVAKQLDHDLEGAKADYKRLLRDYPNHPDVLANLGSIVRRQGQYEAAEALLMRSLRANPSNPPALATLSNLRLNQHRYDEALALAEKALQIQPNYAEAFVNLGSAYAKRGQLKKAESAFRLALGINPRNAAARMNIANCFRMQKVNIQESIQALEQLATIEPRNDELLMCLSMAYMEDRQYVKAIEYAERAYDISKKFDYGTTVAQIQVIIGEFEEAMERYEKALKFDPQNREVAATLLFALNYDDRKSPQDVFNEYRRYGETLAAKHVYTHEDHPPVAGRKLRIGYVSADFFAHVVMYFIEPILQKHDRTRVELFAYSSVTNPDEATQRAQKHFDHWVDALDLSDEELAARIKADQIDVLVDLSGHTTGNRLRMMAYRPAPVQTTYLGYGYTTGMTEIDYFIGDDNFTPPGCENVFTEQVFRVPAPLYAYQPLYAISTPIKPPPALEKGYFTFGSMSRIIRFNNRLLLTWLKILNRVPGSKLRLDQKPFADEATRERFLARLEKLGYRREQVELTSSVPHLEGYHHFDISLDCWPHNAGTTNFEALWMGVPVLSKRDRPSVGCLSQMVLKPLGLDDWIVDTEEEFVERAVALANNLDYLAELRPTLRERVEKSPFTDFVARTRALEAAFAEMMKRFEEKSR